MHGTPRPNHTLTANHWHCSQWAMPTKQTKTHTHTHSHTHTRARARTHTQILLLMNTSCQSKHRSISGTIRRPGLPSCLASGGTAQQRLRLDDLKAQKKELRKFPQPDRTEPEPFARARALGTFGFFAPWRIELGLTFGHARQREVCVLKLLLGLQHCKPKFLDDLIASGAPRGSGRGFLQGSSRESDF